MSDWAEDAMLKAFPRKGRTYFLQLVDEPVVVTKEGKWGPFSTLTVNLQLFAIDEQREFHYMGPVQFKGKPCAFEDFTAYRHILLDLLYEVEGFEHGKHVDLEIIETYDRQFPGKTHSEAGDAHTGPSKPLAQSSSRQEPRPVSNEAREERGQPREGEATGDSIVSPYGQDDPASPSTPCSHESIFMAAEGEVGCNTPKGFYCKDCGERVG